MRVTIMRHTSMIGETLAALRTFGQPERIRWLPERPDLATLFIPRDRDLDPRLEYARETDLESGMARIRKAGAA